MATIEETTSVVASISASDVSDMMKELISLRALKAEMEATLANKDAEILRQGATLIELKQGEVDLKPGVSKNGTPSKHISQSPI